MLSGEGVGEAAARQENRYLRIYNLHLKRVNIQYLHCYLFKLFVFNLRPKGICRGVVFFPTNLLGESRWVSAHTEVRFSCRLVNVLQTVSISIHDQASVVIEQHPNAVVTQLVT